MEQQVIAGFGKGVVRFPKEMFPEEGFCAVHDDPHARLLILKNGQNALALLALELVMCPDDLVRAWQTKIGAAFDVPAENVWIHVNHTITTPHEPGPKGPPHLRPEPTQDDIRKRKLYRAAVEAGIDAAISVAKADLAPARLGWGTGESMVNGNRDVLTPFGWWVGAAGDGTSNHTMTVLRVDNPDGTPKGIVMFHATKPCAIDNSGMRESTRLVSGDVCGTACLGVEEHFGVPVLFCMTAAGDQVPVKQSLLDVVTDKGEIVQADEGAEKGLAYAGELGRQMAADAIKIAESIACDEESCVTDWERVSFSWQKRRSGPHRKLTRELEHTDDGTAEVTAEIFRLGDTALVAAKPEINSVTERELMEESPFARTILITMVNGGMKYMPDKGSFERATWEAQSSMLMPGAAERFVEMTAARLKAML